MFFFIAVRPSVLAENAEFSFGEVGKHIGQLWGQLDAKGKKKYEALAAKDKAAAAKLNA